MATLIEVPGADLPVPKPARRRGKLLGLAALVVLVLAAVSGAVYVWRYQPIVSDGGLTWAGELTADSSSFGQGPHPGNRVSNTFGDEVIVGPLPNGGRMGLLIDLQNNGRHAYPLHSAAFGPYGIEGSVTGCGRALTA